MSFALDNVELYQGDIVMTKELKKELIKKRIITDSKSRNSRAVMNNRRGRWIGSNGKPEVPYVIERSNCKYNNEKAGSQGRVKCPPVTLEIKVTMLIIFRNLKMYLLQLHYSF